MAFLVASLDFVKAGGSRITDVYKRQCFVVAWNKLYRAELFKETGIRYPEGRIHEDEATTYRLFHEAKKLAFLDRALYGYYTENGGSITSVFSAKRLQWLTAHEERIAFFKKNGYEKLLPAAYRKLCDACITSVSYTHLGQKLPGKSAVPEGCIRRA